MRDKKVSIIVLNYNGENLLKKCLESIENKTQYKNYEIIVVDNNSTDSSIGMLQKSFPGVKLIRNSKNYGFPKGNNIGIKRGLKNGADFILLLNNDTEVTKNWLKQMVKVANNDEKIGIVGPKLILPNGKTQNSCCNYNYGLSRKFAPKKRGVADSVTAACMLIKRGVIEKIGFLDENFFPIYYEDIDFCLRSGKVGYKIVYTPQSKVYHHKGITMKKQDWQYEAYHTNQLRFIFKRFPITWIIIRLLLEPWNILMAAKDGKLVTLLSVYSNFFHSKIRKKNSTSETNINKNIFPT